MMANFFRRMLGIAPTPEPDGEGVLPSRLGLLLGVDSKSGYRPADFGGGHDVEIEPGELSGLGEAPASGSLETRATQSANP